MKFGKLLTIFLPIGAFIVLQVTSTIKAEVLLDFLPSILAASHDANKGSQYDNDLDGYSENQGDCNDKEKNIYPSAPEVCGDGIDQDCSGSDLACVAAISTVTSAGQIWMDRNLGASRVAMSPTDSEAYGDLYQWGRLADGHEKRNSPSIIGTSSKDVPGHGNFLIVDVSTLDPYSPNDWRMPQNDNLWQGATGTNNPCPDGFRLPTATELDTERASWSSNDEKGAFASPLKLVMAGWRCYDGSLTELGETGAYSSSTVSVVVSPLESIQLDGSYSKGLTFFSGKAKISQAGVRAGGSSVRCIKD